MTAWAAIFAPGFFSNPVVHTALIDGGVVAVVSAIVGTFTVLRGQSFAGHALADIGTAGGSAAALIGASSLYGFVAVNVLAAAIMDLIGVRSARGRDLATGIVLGAALGLAALFLYEDTTTTSSNSTTVNVLFGTLFTIPGSMTPVIVVFSVVAVALVAVLYRPLILSSVSTDLAAARGIPVRLVAVGYLIALAVAVSLSALTIGAILSTALLIGPPAAALRLAKRTGVAMVFAGLIGLVAAWSGILLAYDSATWTSNGQGWPVSFFIVALVFAFYLVAQAASRPRPERRQAPVPGEAG